MNKDVTRQIGMIGREVRDAQFYGWPWANLIVSKSERVTVYALQLWLVLFSVGFSFTVHH